MANGIDIGTAYVRIEPTAKGIGNKVSDVLNQETAGVGSSVGAKLGGNIGSALKVGLGATAALATTAVAGVAALGKTIVSTAKDTAAYGDNVDKLSQKIGISAEAFQEWDYIFSQNGADIGILETGMKTLSSAVYDASNGSASAQAKFEALGLSVEDLSSMTQEDIFGTVVERLQEMPEGAERTALAADVLGRSAMELQPLLNQTADSTEALRQQAHDLGMVMSDTAVKDSAAFKDSMDNLTRAFEGAKNEIGAAFLPSLTEVTNGLANLIAGNEGAQESIVKGFSSMGDTIASAIPRIVDTFSTLVVAIAEIAPDIIGSLADGILNALPTVFPVIVNVVTKLLQMFIENLPMIIDVGVQLIGQLIVGISQALPELIPAAIDAILTLVDNLINNVDLLIDCAVQLVTGLAVGLVKAIPVLVEKAPIIIEKLVVGIIGAIPKLVVAAGQIITNFMQAINNIAPRLQQVGQNLVTGLKNGIINAWNGMVAKVKDMANNLVRSVKSVFDINSPSRVFAQIGDYCVQGFDEGFDTFGTGAVQDVKDAMEEISAVGSPTFTPEINAEATKYRSVGGNTSDLYGLLSQYLPLLERQTAVNVSLEGDAQGLFRQVRAQTNQFIKSTGASPFVSPA